MKKRQTKDFDIPGKILYRENNPRGKKADWIEFACIQSEIDTIMQALGKAMEQTSSRELPAGTLLAQICRKYLEDNSND